MSSWIRADADFGAPLLRLTIDCRSEAGREFQRILGGRMEPNQPECVALLAAAMTEFVESRRPDLRGCSLIGFSRSNLRLQWELDIVHPSVERVHFGGEVPRQRLETCWTCGNSLSVDGQMWVRSVPNRRSPHVNKAMAEQFGETAVAVVGVEVCCEACIKADRYQSGKAADKAESITVRGTR